MVFTAGDDGIIKFWDIQKKTPIKQMDFGENNPVSCTKMSHDGTALAYSLSYTWYKGIWGMGLCDPKIFVHQM